MSRKVRTGVLGALFALVVGIGTLAVLEVVARPLWKRTYNDWLAGQLSGYDSLDYSKSLIVPVPNTVRTVAGHRAALTETGKTQGLEYFEGLLSVAAAAGQPLGDEEVAFQINAFGFKGPDIDVPKPDSVFRILALGNSCTWGPDVDVYTYPRVLERRLNDGRDGGDPRIEVVNGGVRGYNLERTLARLDETLVVEPDLVTIYLGWNRTIGRADPRKSVELYRASALYRILYHAVLDPSRKRTGDEVLVYDPEDEAMAAYEAYSFDADIRRLDELVQRIRTHDAGIQIVIVTIAGLFDRRVEPDPKALSMAYPISATENLYAYSALTANWNEALRRYAENHGVQVIDLESEALTLLSPRSEHFFDSVHPTVQAHERIGTFFAESLRSSIPGVP